MCSVVQTERAGGKAGEGAGVRAQGVFPKSNRKPKGYIGVGWGLGGWFAHENSAARQSRDGSRVRVDCR